ncbi:MAG TPA: MaoC family dehydratase [Acidimicrobiia bacterium]
MSRRRSFELTDDLLRMYSRRGNFHSDPEAAAELGYRKLVAQGMQVAAPAYGLLLDAWGEEFLAHGSVELKFVGMVTGGERVKAEVTLTEAPEERAQLEVTSTTTGRTAVVGSAHRRNPHADR